jgi:Cyclic nucleotide-binding domain
MRAEELRRRDLRPLTRPASKGAGIRSDTAATEARIRPGNVRENICPEDEVMATFADVDVSDLILKKSYSKATKVLRARVDAEPDKPFLRQQLADVLLLDGKKGDALPVLFALADEFARDGLVAKAIAVLKKIQRLDPSARGIDAKLARLFKDRDEQDARHANLHKAPASLEQLARKASAAASSFEPSARFDGTPPAPKPIPLSDVTGEEFILELNASSLAEPSAPSSVEGLSRTPLFSDLDAGELVALMDGLKLVTIESGDIIVSEGEPGSSMFILSTGTAKAWVKDAAGKAHPIRTMTDGEFFGEVSILTGRNRTATVTAATRCDLLELDRETVKNIATTYPRVNQVLTDFCQERIANPKEHLIRQQGAG